MGAAMAVLSTVVFVLDHDYSILQRIGLILFGTLYGLLILSAIIAAHISLVCLMYRLAGALIVLCSWLAATPLNAVLQNIVAEASQVDTGLPLLREMSGGGGHGAGALMLIVLVVYVAIALFQYATTWAVLSQALLYLLLAGVCLIVGTISGCAISLPPLIRSILKRYRMRSLQSNLPDR